MKIIRYGMVSEREKKRKKDGCNPLLLCLKIARREYRGQRTAEAIQQYVKDQMRDPVQVLESRNELASKVNVWSLLRDDAGTFSNV